MFDFFRKRREEKERKRKWEERLATRIKLSVQVETKDGKLVNAEAEFYPDVMNNPAPSVEVQAKEDFMWWKSYSGCPANAATFDVATGKHVTWGQGRYELDDFPRLTAQSHLSLKIAIDRAQLANKHKT